MENYAKAVSEMYSQFKQKEVHPMGKYVGRHVVYLGGTREIVGYATRPDGSCCLIIDGSAVGGWSRLALGPFDVVFKKCERYSYVGINNSIY